MIWRGRHLISTYTPSSKCRLLVRQSWPVSGTRAGLLALWQPSHSPGHGVAGALEAGGEEQPKLPSQQVIRQRLICDGSLSRSRCAATLTSSGGGAPLAIACAQ